MKTKFSSGMVVCVALVTTIALLAACGQGLKRVLTLSDVGTQQTVTPGAVQQQVTWPDGLPEDKAQPWEEMDANGHVVPPKGASNLNFDSIFAAGIERYLEAGDVADYGEVSSFSSGAAGGEEMSYAIYRLPMGVDQPGTITADVNVHNGGSYYIGVGDYSVNTWHWYGPFGATHVRFNVPEAEYTSGIGNLMLAVVAYDGASFDVVAIGANARDVADADAPPAPAAPTLTAVAGGLFTEWLEVAAGDLAGYRIYADGEEVLDYLEGGTSIVVPATSEVDVTLSAVDISGNESEMSDASTETPLAGKIPAVELTTTAASGMRNDSITLTATGAETYDWDIDGDGVWDFTDDPTDTRDADTADLGVIRPAIRAHTAEGGFSLNAISLFITGNFRPVVMLTASETEFHLGKTGPASVSFDAGGSYDPDGTFLNYYFDPEGDGSYVDNGTDPTLDHDYWESRSYLAGLRVTDSDGDFSCISLFIRVHRFGSTTADSAGSVGLYTSLAVVDGYPAISYYDATDQDLKYVGACDASGSSWGTPVTVASSGEVGYYTSLAVVNGNPAISYWDFSNNDLKYARANDGSGGTWGTPVVIDSTGDVGGFTSLAVVNGNPAISYTDWTNYDLKYVRATNADGSTWDTPLTVDGTGNVGEYTSLVIVNGNPAISYRDNTNWDLKYVRASDANGGSWGTPLTVDSAGDVGKYTSLAVVNGNPAISYYDGDGVNGDLKYVWATDASGDNWGTPIIVDDGVGGNVGEWTSLAVVNGSPAISYFDDTNNDLKYVRASDASGGSWGALQILDSAGSVGGYTSLAVVNGKPAVSYYDYTNDDLKFAYPRLD